MGTLGPEQQKEPTYHMYLASEGRFSYTEQWACSRLNNTWNAACSLCKLRHAHVRKDVRKDTRHSAFPYCNWHKARQEIGMRLPYNEPWCATRCWRSPTRHTTSQGLAKLSSLVIKLDRERSHSKSSSGINSLLPQALAACSSNASRSPASFPGPKKQG